MAQRGVRGEAEAGVPLQAAPDEVEEQGVVAAFEGGLQLSRAGRAARLAATRTPTVKDSRAVRKCCCRTVSWIA